MRKRGLCCRPVSVRLSVRHLDGLYRVGWRYRQTSFSARYSLVILVFLTLNAGTQLQGEPLQRERKIQGRVGKFFDIRQKRYEMGPYGCYETLIGSHMRSVEWWYFQWSWRTPITRLSRSRHFEVEYLTNSASKGQCYYRTLIGNYIQSIEWYHFQWPWRTLTQFSRSRYFWSRISQKRCS